MSLKDEQSQEYNLRAGLAIFSGQVEHRTDLNDNEKSNAQASVRKEPTSSSNASSIKNTSVPSSSSPSSNVKQFGSNRLFVSTKK